MRALALALLCSTALAEEWAPPPAEKVPGYSAAPMPCTIGKQDGRARVTCKGGLLDGKSLRELAILRNTIYARYGWDGFRKPWLRDHFRAQPWFRPNAKFSYKLTTEADRQNAHFIAVKEQSFTQLELEHLRDDVFARHGKVWSDLPKWEAPDGKITRSCTRPAWSHLSDEDLDAFPACRYAKRSWYKPNPSFRDDQLGADDRVELGLIARALGEFAVDNPGLGVQAGSLDELLDVAKLRQLSLRDLRLLRNTIYARRGRLFKSLVLHDHFAGMSWYQPRSDYSDALLTRTDVRNIHLIRSVEDELGGAISDEDLLAEPSTDGA
jgi:hypothetical protein